MPRDGSGNFQLPALNPVVNGTAISSTWANNTLTDVATALTGSIAKNGETTPTADLPMGTQKHTNCGDATARNQYGAAGQIQDNDFNVLGSVSGTNTILGSLTPAITAYSAGMHVTFVPANTNTGAATIAINGLAALDIQKGNAAALVAGDLVAGIPAVLVLDAGADDWILLNPQNIESSGSFTATLTGMTGVVQGTMNYRIVGRICTLYLASAILGTSNSTGLALSASLPAACQPATDASLWSASFFDNGTAVSGLAEVGSLAVSFRIGVVSGTKIQTSLTGWTNSGSKGLLAGWTVSYPL